MGFGKSLAHIVAPALTNFTLVVLYDLEPAGQYSWSGILAGCASCLGLLATNLSASAIPLYPSMYLAIAEKLSIKPICAFHPENDEDCVAKSI